MRGQKQRHVIGTYATGNNQRKGLKKEEKKGLEEDKKNSTIRKAASWAWDEC